MKSNNFDRFEVVIKFNLYRELHFNIIYLHSVEGMTMRDSIWVCQFL